MESQPTPLPLSTGLGGLPAMVAAEGEFASLVAALRQGRAGSIDGAWNSAASLGAAALGQYAPSTVLIVVAHPRDIDFWSDDLNSFAGQRPLIFPAWDALPTAETVVDEIGSQRLRVLRQLESNQAPRYLLTTFQALLQPVPNRQQLAQQRRRLKVGQTVDLDELTAWLIDHGFQRMEAVELPGEFSRRGGIFDLFSHDAEVPYRIEIFGDEIESLRQFSVETQRSLADLQAIEITAVLLNSGEWRVASGETALTTHHSPLTTHHSPLTTHHSPLTNISPAPSFSTTPRFGG